MELTWLTFPTIVIVVSATAYYGANWIKGDDIRVNHAEYVDVDAATGQIRGTYWAHVFSPRSAAYNFSLQPTDVALVDGSDPHVHLSWMARPQMYYGGMSSGESGGSFFGSAYVYAPDLSSLSNVSITMWSTKNLTARWDAKGRSPVSALFSEGPEQTLEGMLTSELDGDLKGVYLLYDRFVYELPDMASGDELDLANFPLPRLTKTWLGSAGIASRDARTLLRQMSFYSARAENPDQVSMVNRTADYCDLSEQLSLGKAVLIAQVDRDRGSRLLHNGEPIGAVDDQRITYLRIVFPVSGSPSGSSPEE
jgi:hypothetical protein